MHAVVRQFWRKMGVLTNFPSSLSTGLLLLVLPPFLGDVPFPPTIPRPRVPLAVFIRAMADMYKYIYYKLCCTAALNDEYSGDKRLQLVASSPPPSPPRETSEALTNNQVRPPCTSQLPVHSKEMDACE